MPHIKIAPRTSKPEEIDVEIGRLRDLDVAGLKTRWEIVQGGKAPAHLPRHLLFRLLAYRLQIERIGDLDGTSKRILDRSGSPEDASKRAADAVNGAKNLRLGTTVGREWKGDMHRVTVLNEGFAWNGTTYSSLSKVAFAITGTRWNGPRFFGLRDRTDSPEQSA